MNAKKSAGCLPQNRSSYQLEKTGFVAHAMLPSTSSAASRVPVTELAERDLLAFFASDQASRVSKIVAIASLSDTAKLVALAAHDLPLFARRDALLRLDAVLDGRPLPADDLARLAPCLAEQALIAYTVTLMDIADYDWCAHCDEGTVTALCLALDQHQSAHESILLEDAFAHLMHSRPDLGRNLRACSPGKLHLKAMYDPLLVNNMVYIDLTKEDNVA
ncbi:hypothetical protein [Gordonibacter sp.]|uniref:hypothetical protein n=1 Tax=Gordonibacter sp. TaxID=1968902 RepID=UPI002FCB7B02